MGRHDVEKIIPDMSSNSGRQRQQKRATCEVDEDGLHSEM